MNITTINDVSTSYNFTIKGLEEDSSYIITVKETNAAGSAVGDPVTAITMEAGKVLNGWHFVNRMAFNSVISSRSICSTNSYCCI